MRGRTSTTSAGAVWSYVFATSTILVLALRFCWAREARLKSGASRSVFGPPVSSEPRPAPFAHAFHSADEFLQLMRINIAPSLDNCP